MGQNLFYAGMNQTTATFTSALSNVLPALTFIMAWILRVENVNLKKLHSKAKIVGTLVTVGGAMIMTIIAGPELGLPWTKDSSNNTPSGNSTRVQHPVKGALMIAAGNFGYSLFYILQAITLKSYPVGLTLTTLICTTGALQGTILTFAVERGNFAIWSIGWDSKLLAYAYGGIISSGVTYYISGIIMGKKGPVFVTAFNPLNMVIIAIASSFIFAEQLDVGKVIGAVVIVIGLYLVIWGKSKDQIESIDIDTKLELPSHHKQVLVTNSNNGEVLKTTSNNNDV
ncbi:hypothetical protein RD792_000539 [Penstemon davidsonii]|uniref:WAT1-related protein n=1 Tax=Penstemon davidsonii TaxID=160366 RepID=A0ABR0DL55_9LAMI|nr:hypothetical protein RD792_000539 [Penstemon davidsonii]